MMILFLILFGTVANSVCIILAIKYGTLMSIKGYNVSVITGLSIIYFFTSLFFIALWSVRLSSISGLLGGISASVIGLSLTIGLYGIVASKLPYKENKTFGKRTVPLSLTMGLYAITVFIIVIATFVLLVTLFPEKFYGAPLKWYDYLKFIGTFSLLTSFLLAGFKKKMLFNKQKEIADYTDKKFDVLYLRSFYLDTFSFSTADSKQTNEFGNLIKLQSSVYQDLRSKASLTFEEYFGFQINKQIGEFICIGNPNNRIPKDGIIDLYPKWSEWQNFLSIFIDHSRIILMQIGNSKHIIFELNAIIKSGNIHKLCLFTHPQSDNVNETETSKRKFRNWIQNSKKLNWEETKELILGVGLKIPFVPSPGSVIVFSKEGEAILLKSGCGLPSEYVTVVKNYFANE